MKEEFSIEFLNESINTVNYEYQKYKNFENQKYIKNLIPKLYFLIDFVKNKSIFNDIIFYLFISSLWIIDIFLLKEFVKYYNYNILYLSIFILFSLNFKNSIENNLELNKIFNNINIRSLFRIFYLTIFFSLLIFINDYNFILLGLIITLFLLLLNNKMKFDCGVLGIFIVIYVISYSLFKIKLILSILMAINIFLYVLENKRMKINFQILNHYELIIFLCFSPLLNSFKDSYYGTNAHIFYFIFFNIIIIFNMFLIIKLLLVNLTKVTYSYLLLIVFSILLFFDGFNFSIIVILIYWIKFYGNYRNKEINIKKDLTINKSFI